MKKQLSLLLALIIATVGKSVYAQDMHFSQFYETSILRNPALTGIFSEDYKFGVQYRSQWGSVISKPFQTAVVSAETRIPVNKNVNDFISFGLIASYDKAGSVGLQKLTIYPAVNYNKIINEEHSSYFSAGFTGGYVQRNYDLSKATFNNQYQNNTFSQFNATGEQYLLNNVHHWDMGAGISFSTNTGVNNKTNYFIGVSGYHFTQPRQTFANDNTSTIGMRFNVTGGISTVLNDQLNLQTYANYAIQRTYSEIMAGGLLGWHKAVVDQDDITFAFYAGLFYRFNDAIVPVVKLKFKNFDVGMSYDVNVSKLKPGSNLKGGFELTVFKTGLFKDPNLERSSTICPRR